MLGPVEKGGSALHTTIYPYNAVLNSNNEWEYFSFAHDHTLTEISRGYHVKYHEPVAFRILVRGPAIGKDICLMCGCNNERNILIDDGFDPSFHAQQPRCCLYSDERCFSQAAMLARRARERAARPADDTHPPPQRPPQRPSKNPNHLLEMDRATSTLLRRAEASRSAMESAPRQEPDHLPPRSHNLTRRDSASSTSTQEFPTSSDSSSSNGGYRGKDPARPTSNCSRASSSASAASAPSSASSSSSYAQAARKQQAMGPIQSMIPGIHAKPKSRSSNPPIISYHLARPDPDASREPAKARKTSN